MIETPPMRLNLSPRERSVLSLVRQHDGITRGALIRMSGLSNTAVFRATEDLSDRNFVRVGEPLADGRGQPSHRIWLNPDAVFTLGLSVMNDFAEATIIDLAGTVRALVDVSAPGMRRADILANTCAMLDNAAEAWLSRGALCGAGVAVAAYFVDENRLLNPAAALDDWALTDFSAEFAQVFHCPVTIENIGNAAAVGEALLGAGREYRSFAYLNFSSGFGGGVILDGRPWRGAYGNAGEFAGVLKAANMFIPSMERLREMLVDSGVPCGSISELVNSYDDNWDAIDHWTAETAPSLRALADIIGATLDVEAIVLGGRLPAALARRLVGAIAMPQARFDEVARRGRARRAPDIIAARISAQSATIGAATLAMPEVMQMRSPT